MRIPEEEGGMKVPITQRESEEYLEGWASAHRGLQRDTVTVMTESETESAWLRGWDDCAAGRINADWALGPAKLPAGAMKEV